MEKVKRRVLIAGSFTDVFIEPQAPLKIKPAKVAKSVKEAAPLLISPEGLEDEVVSFEEELKAKNLNTLKIQADEMGIEYPKSIKKKDIVQKIITASKAIASEEDFEI